MTLPRLESLSHSELIEKIKSIRSGERLASAEVVLYLYEIDNRGLETNYEGLPSPAIASEAGEKTGH